MAELFGVDIPVITKDLNNIYKENELQKESTISNSLASLEIAPLPLANIHFY